MTQLRGNQMGSDHILDPVFSHFLYNHMQVCYNNREHFEKLLLFGVQSYHAVYRYLETMALEE